jgi:plastocyanin
MEERAWSRSLRRGALLTALGSALVLPMLAFGHAPATEIQVRDNTFGPQSPAPRRFQHGSSFHWQRAASSTGFHNVLQDDGLFSSGDLTDGPIDYTISASAGSYHYYCEAHGSTEGGMAGVVKVRPAVNTAPSGNPFTVIWADSGTSTGNAFDVRYRVGTTGAWQLWRNDKAQFQAVFGQNRKPVAVTPGTTYQFQVRSELACDHSKLCGWSPTLTFTP